MSQCWVFNSLLLLAKISSRNINMRWLYVEIMICKNLWVTLLNMKEIFWSAPVDHKGLYNSLFFFFYEIKQVVHWKIKVNISYFPLSGQWKPNILFRFREYLNSRVTSARRREDSLLHSAAQELRNTFWVLFNCNSDESWTLGPHVLILEAKNKHLFEATL